MRIIKPKILLNERLIQVQKLKNKEKTFIGVQKLKTTINTEFDTLIGDRQAIVFGGRRV